jgi:hypothetical protein
MQFDFYQKYNLKVIIALLMTYFEACTFVNPHGDELNYEGDMFGARVFFEKFFQTFVTRELSLFKRLYFQLHVGILLLVAQPPRVIFECGIFS